MKRSSWSLWLVAGMTASIALAGCDGCTPEPSGDAGVVTGDKQLAFLSPLNGAVLTVMDDLDTSADGIQITVRVHLDPAAAVNVKLLVDDVEVGSVEPADSRATFTNVTLSASADGVEHTITAEADGYDSDTITVTARVEEAVPDCEFLQPVAATVTPPFSVTVTCLQARANEPGTLRLLDADGQQVGAAYTGQLNGNLRFTATGIDPADGDYTLAFALDAFPATAIEKDITVQSNVLPPAPTCTITAPTATAPPATSPGFDVTVECQNVPAGVTSVTVTLDGATTSPVSFTGTLALSGNVMTAVVAVAAVEAGSTEITAEVTNFPASADVITVEVPSFPVCDAEIVRPLDGATDLIDIDLATPGNQINVTVGAVGDPAACTGAAVEVFLDDASVATGILSGNAAQSGTATFIVTVGEGESTISAVLTLNDAAGASAEATVTFTSPPVGIRLAGIRDCDGFGDGCFNLSDANQGTGTEYQRTLVAAAPAQNGACPFTDPLLDVEGHDQDVRADGDTDGVVGDAWSFNNGFCEATFTNVTLHANASPDEVLLTLTLDVSLVGGASETRDFELGLDRVAPVLTWTTVDGASFGGADDEDTLTAILDVALNATVSGMDGRSLLLVPTNDLTDVLDTCIASGASDAACAFVVTLADGSYDLDVIGQDAAGNDVISDVLEINLDSNSPCVASITVAADANSDGTVNAAEGGTAPITTDVTVTFDTAECAIENGRTATLVSSATGNLGTAITSANAVTFSDVSLSEGSHTLSVQVSDEAGNAVVATGNSADLVVDTSPPSCAISAPVASSLVAADDEVPGTAGLQVSFTISTDGAAARLLINAVEAGSGPATGGTFTVSDVTLANGSPTITAECTDAAGNLATSVAYEPVVDAILPTAAFNNPPATLGSAQDADGAAPGVQTTINIDVSLVETGRPVAIYLADAQGAPTGSALGSADTTSDTTGGGSETVAIAASFPVCAPCSYVVQVTDAAGNVGLSATTTISVSSTLLVCSFDNPDGSNDPLRIGSAFESGGSASISFVVTCPTLTVGASAELFVNDTLTETVSASGETITFAAVTLAPGTGTVQVLVDDGTSVGGSALRDYVVDVVAPVVSWSFTTPTVRMTRNAADGGADLAPLDNSDAAGYQATLSATVNGCDGEQVIVTADGTQVNAGTPPVSSGGIVSLPVSIPDGDAQDLVVSCSDDVNNAVASVVATVDTVPPAAPSDFTAVLDATADATRMGWVDIDFTMPGDDGATGTVTSVDLVASHSAVTDFDAPDAAVPFVSIPLTPATTLPITTGVGGVPALWFGPHTWNVALRAADDVGNVADADLVTGVVDFPVATVSFDVLHREIDHVDVEGGQADQFGGAISTARGDINGDGIDDLVIGAQNAGASCISTFCNGAIFILYGATNTAGLSTRDLHRIDGPAGDLFFGWEVAIAPSINGDGVDDLLVASFLGAATPAVSVYHGRSDGGQLDAAPNWVMTDPGSGSFGSRLAGVGDVNGDGINDWTAGDQGNGTAPLVYLFLGSASVDEGASPFTRTAEADVTFALPAGSSFAPSGVAALTNLDGDDSGAGRSLDDFAIGAASVSGAGNEGGRVFVLHGRETWPAAITLNDALATPDTVLKPSTAFGNQFGHEVSGGDIDGDGDVDLLVRGNIHVVVFLNGGTGFAGTGTYRLKGNYGVASGRTGLTVGDLNGDGRADVALAAQLGAWIYLGDDRSSQNREIPSLKYEHPATLNYVIGQSGDLDNDGLDDLAYVDRGNATVHLRFGP